MAMACTGASSMAAAVLGPRLPTSKPSRSSALPYLPPCPATLSFSTSSFHVSENHRLTSLQVRASSSEETSGSVEVGEVFTDLKEKSSRKELATDIEALKKKITGSE
uniref:Uncharacterized protein n=1 Tax=Nelumbo nucifera TaxID=4432 RepID=A0A822ZHY9_NELNU|nr:TPA_asm: hypothetical protein HUJ06_001501 [Nelumbo nucifera]